MLEKAETGQSKSTWDTITGHQTWVYQFDPETKQQSSIYMDVSRWILAHKIRKNKSAGKQMVATSCLEIEDSMPLPRCSFRTNKKPMLTGTYINVNLKSFKLLNQCCTKTGLCRLMLHHDNVLAHTTKATVDFPDWEWSAAHPASPYSPDLAPCNWFLLPEI